MHELIKQYISKNNQDFQRYNSWNHCFNAFGNPHLDNDTLALHLGFYLASWGMYRGSSGVLQFDYKIHLKAISILKQYNNLRCNKDVEVDKSDIKEINELKEKLSKHYRSFKYLNSKNKIRSINPTDTLLSKIILGTLGCLPAFDRLFIKGVKKTINTKRFTTLKEKSLYNLFDFISTNHGELSNIKKQRPNYTIMKIVDMYFWQIGNSNS